MESKDQHVPNSNPQDPTLPTDVKESENREHVSEGKSKLEKKTDSKKRKRKRGRTVGVATVVEEESSPELRLPQNHYRIILRRRALRKQDGNRRDPPQLDANNPEFEAYGDISLGMKLNVVGGRVIVQSLIPLEDGRASPAQLSGLIRRGDILVSIGDVNLVNIPIDQLRDGLRPLNTPDSKGLYQGTLDICFAAGEGLQALIKNETTQTVQVAGSGREAIANEVSAFFPIVEPLHGLAPPTENNNLHPTDNIVVENDKEDQNADPPPLIPPPLPIIKAQSRAVSVLPIATVNAEISQSIATWRARDRDNFMGEYFLWNEQFSDIMRRCSDIILPTNNVATRILTRSERLLLGNKAILGAKTLGSRIENLDKGEDLRSFRQWNSSISLRSRASNRRHYFLELASLPAHFETRSEAENHAPTIMSDDSGGAEEDSDDMLLNLAAHDEIWREQVLTSLGKAGDELDGKEVEKRVGSEEKAPPSDLQDALSDDFGALLLGDMSKMVAKKSKPVALPPEEITSVLFDLSTHIASTMPDEITFLNVTSSHVPKLSSPYSITKPTTERNHSMSLATRFLLDDALPMWLKTFRPLTWDYRRILWPLGTTQSGQGESYISDADSLTFDGSLTSSQRPNRKTKRLQSKRTLRENIEENELNVQTRSETCFLVTYFFTQKLLAQAALSQSRPEKGFDVSQERLVDFVASYGAYLQLNTCLAYSASLKCKDVIVELLKVAQEDPRHREVIKLFNKKGVLVPYDHSMLSAAMSCLPNIVSSKSGDRRQFLIDICVSAYPGVCPWQVRTVCLGSVEDDKFKELYYNYLTQLLHPVDGSEYARKDEGLVKEWCELSLENDESSLGYKPRSKANFLLIASRHAMAHTAFVRDVLFLFELSQKVSDDDLVLDLADEILDRHEVGEDNSLSSNVMGSIRKIAFKAVDDGNFEKNSEAYRQLKRCMQLILKMENLVNGDHHVSLANEMKTLLEYRVSKADGDINKVLELVYHLAHESMPDDFLKALALWELPVGMESCTVPVLQSVLKIGTSIAMDSELSGSLFRLHRARLRNSNGSGILPRPLESKRNDSSTEKSLWEQMATGVLSVDK